MNAKSMILALCIVFFWIGSAAADTKEASGLQAILEQQRSLAADLDAGKTGNLKSQEVEAIRKSQQEIFKVTEGKTDVDELRPDEKVVVMNHVEKIKAIMGGTRVAQRNKEICKRERISGSNLTQTVCATQEERDQRREMNREQMEKRRICEGAGCGT